MEINNNNNKDVGVREELQKYKEAFDVACDLLNNGILYGYDKDEIFSEIMERDGCVSKYSYQDFIIEHLNELTGKD